MNRHGDKILIIAAHPDDEVLGCGGIIQEYKKKGAIVCVCIVTDGSSAQYEGDEKIKEQKYQECQKANKILEVDQIINLGFPDMNLDTVSHCDLNKKIEEVVNGFKPNVIYTHSSLDINKDHFLVNQSTMIIARPGKEWLKEVYEYEVLSSTEWQRYDAFAPNVFLKIDSFIETKIKAFEQYRTEIRKHPHPRSPEGIRLLAGYRGLQSGYQYAEAFKLVISYR